MRMPSDVAAYKRTSVFDQDTLPAGLTRNHRTAPGVWAMIRVVEGRLIYRTGQPPSETTLDPQHPAVVAPQQTHEVAPCGPVRFFVEFYRKADAARKPGAAGDG